MIEKDQFGIVIKFPERECKDCLWYPCMSNFEIFKTPFAKYGCRDYKNKKENE